jgi:hypothetical protein
LTNIVGALRDLRCLPWRGRKRHALFVAFTFDTLRCNECNRMQYAVHVLGAYVKDRKRGADPPALHGQSTVDEWDAGRENL